MFAVAAAVVEAILVHVHVLVLVHFHIHICMYASMYTYTKFLQQERLGNEK